MTTLRARLIFWYIGIVTAALSLFAGLLYAWLARTLYAHHDGELGDDAARIVQSLTTAADPLSAVASLDAAERVGPLLLVRDSSGRILFRSARLTSSERDIGEHTVLQHAVMQGPTEAQFFTVTLARGAPARFICLPLTRPAKTYLQLGRRLGDVDLLLRVVVIASIVLVPVVVLVTSYGGLFVAGRALMPIGAIAGTLESIQATDLTRRVDTGRQDAEVSRLSASVNRLLDRLQRAFASLREFSADVSHQLQTPLTIVKGVIEVALASPRSGDEYRRTLTEVAEEIDALSATVRVVREFGLAEVEATERGRECVPFSEVMQEAADLLAVLAEDRQVDYASAIAPEMQVWGNRIRLRQLLLNLGENALAFTPTGGRVRVTLEPRESNAVLTVEDTGAGIPAAALPQIFERRYHTSVREGGGSGLGLALVKRIVEAHGGTIDVVSRVGHGTTVTVRLPVADRV